MRAKLPTKNIIGGIGNGGKNSSMNPPRKAMNSSGKEDEYVVRVSMSDLNMYLSVLSVVEYIM